MAKKRKNYTKEQRLDYYIKKQKQDYIKTHGLLAFLKAYEPEKYRKAMDKGL